MGDGGARVSLGQSVDLDFSASLEMTFGGGPYAFGQEVVGERLPWHVESRRSDVGAGFPYGKQFNGGERGRTGADVGGGWGSDRDKPGEVRFQGGFRAAINSFSMTSLACLSPSTG